MTKNMVFLLPWSLPASSSVYCIHSSGVYAKCARTPSPLRNLSILLALQPYISAAIIPVMNISKLKTNTITPTGAPSTTNGKNISTKKTGVIIHHTREVARAGLLLFICIPKIQLLLCCFGSHMYLHPIHPAFRISFPWKSKMVLDFCIHQNRSL